ncbi:MAG: carbon-nitrogen hydrolase family protein [Verrucomicrobiia bacterium]
MIPTSSDPTSRVTRREAIKRAAGVAGLAALSQLPNGRDSNAAQVRSVQSATGNAPGHDAEHGQKLRIATAQFPVSGNPVENAKYIRDFMRNAAEGGAHLLHTSEACLSGYAGIDVPSADHYDWDAIRKETTGLRKLAKDLNLWLVLGSAHFLGEKTKPTNCLYLIDPEGRIADRYDKCFCTGGDQKHYSVGDRLVTRDIRRVRIGLAICYDICWPQLYIAYREKGATVMVHSFHNARSKGPNCLDTLNIHQVATRCADNRMWAVCNNSSQPYSHWGSFIARPDATIPKRLEINQPGMLIHDFPDGLSEGGWYHNFKPMQKRDDEVMCWGTPTKHPRQADGQAEA